MIILILELHLIVKSTTTASTPRYIETKPRKTAHKEKPKKWKRPRGRKEQVEYGDSEDEDLTTTLVPDSKSTPLHTISYTPSRPPSWVIHSNSMAPKLTSDAAVVFGLICLHYLHRK